MSRFFILIIALLLLLVNSGMYVQGSIFQTQESASSKKASSVEMAVLSPEPDTTVAGDFFVTGIASDRQEGVEAVDVTFTSLFDKEQIPIKEYSAYHNDEGKWSTHIKQGDLADDVYAITVTVHTKEGTKRYLFSTVIVDSTQTSKITTL